jgi:hypothetical protein
MKTIQALILAVALVAAVGCTKVHKTLGLSNYSISHIDANRFTVTCPDGYVITGKPMSKTLAVVGCMPVQGDAPVQPAAPAGVK